MRSILFCSVIDVQLISKLVDQLFSVPIIHQKHEFEMSFLHFIYNTLINKIND